MDRYCAFRYHLDINRIHPIFGMQPLQTVKTETLLALLIISVRNFEKRQNSLFAQKLYEKEIGPTVYGLFDTKHLLFSSIKTNYN